MRRAVAALTIIRTLTALPLLAQATPTEPVALATLGGQNGPTGLGTPALQASYRIRLTSDWPQLVLAGTNCVNGGTEILLGNLVRNGDGYAGRLERQAHIRFCGTHGPVSGEPCALTLTSRGPVTARAEVLMSSDRPVASLRWGTEAEAENVIAVEGNCSPAFNQSLKKLYLGVTHALEFPLPLTGQARLPFRLEDYGWIVEVW